MNAKNVLISLIPWVLFSVIVQRRGPTRQGTRVSAPPP